MKNGYGHTIAFVFLVSVVFSAILAGVNAFYLPSIEKNAELAEKRSILYTLELDNQGDREQIEQIFLENVQEKKIAGIDAYVRVDTDQKELAYAFPVKGSGLWGTIEGYLAVSSDFSQITGIDFTSHSETPGLGGRIDEAWFKDQFRGLSIDDKKGLSYKRGEEGDIDAITGATLTSSSVLEIVNGLIKTVLEGSSTPINQNKINLELYEEVMEDGTISYIEKNDEISPANDGYEGIGEYADAYEEEEVE
jgi:Na+-transporting NADH:ubiquinone oxidoreductase subunit C